MNQSIWCIQHSQWHDVVDRDDQPPVIRYRADHLHVIESWMTERGCEILECVVCGDQWGAA
jgi:hypothetical protein